jgi:hypothetical protein
MGNEVVRHRRHNNGKTNPQQADLAPRDLHIKPTFFSPVVFVSAYCNEHP